MGANHVADKPSQNHLKDPLSWPGKTIGQKCETCKNICSFSQGSGPKVHIRQKHKNGNGIPSFKLGVKAQVLLHKTIKIDEAPKPHPSGKEHHHIVIEAQPLSKGIIHPFNKKCTRFKSIKPISIMSIAQKIRY
jgi:hypothetical protein